MGRNGITKQQVTTAAEILIGERKDVNIRSIREYLGSGSPNTIHKYLKVWNDERANKKEEEKIENISLKDIKENETDMLKKHISILEKELNLIKSKLSWEILMHKKLQESSDFMMNTHKENLAFTESLLEKIKEKDNYIKKLEEELGVEIPF